MTYCCPGHDPLIAAGFTECATCRARAYADDAAWLGGGLLIAAYPAVCRHMDPSAQVVDPAQLEHAPPQCVASTRGGRQCRNPAGEGSAWCRVHRPATDREAGR